ncbi:MAG: DUF2905 domain-containing protein [Flavisolibacter sp.]|jgi:hypothetical protein|nr:DUF2905 domain-containing protein [Flavisolibacter sp.]
MDQNTGKYIILFGLLAVVTGILIYFFYDKMQWIGRLPGDIRIEKENSRVYFPITTMILLSLSISLLIYLFQRIF